jgi:heme-degrading monooxygenase HmoA
MYIAVRRYKIAPGSTPELRRRIQQEFMPIVSKVPGFIEYFCTFAGENEMFSVNVFEDRAGAEGSVRAAADYVRDHKSLFPNPPEVISGEVMAHQAREEIKRAA